MIIRKMLRDLFFHCAPDILGGLYFRFGVNLVPEKKYPVDMDGVKRVCVLAAPDMDDLTALTPMIHSVRHSIPDVWITIAVSSDKVRETIHKNRMASAAHIHKRILGY